ncbi:hypothetical protein GLO24_13020 [Carnobacterium maltaromaticum]|nr:hypothetical protein [Carnobacterium maltaromaticum]
MEMEFFCCMPTPSKPFKTIKEQIAIISGRNVNIDESDFVIEALDSISYYTLMNGYKDSFLSEDDTENFKTGTSFYMIYTLHWLDISFSNIILKYILLIEKSLKTKLSYYIGNEIGVTTIEYLDDFRNYSNATSTRSGILRDIKKTITTCRSGSVTEYYRDQKDHIPPWIIVNDISFGLAQLWCWLL